MNETDIQKLKLIQWLAEEQNKLLRGLVERATEILKDEDVAADLVYGILDVDKAVSFTPIP